MRTTKKIRNHSMFNELKLYVDCENPKDIVF